MVGNKAQKAVAAALTGMMVLGSAAPAFAGQQLSNNWWRVNGDHTETYAFSAVTDVTTAVPPATSGAGTNLVRGVDRYDTMWDMVNFNEANGIWNVDGTGTTGLGNERKNSAVVLVSGTSYADALSASSLAGVFGAPIITTPADTLDIQAERAIRWFAGKAAELDPAGNPKLTVYIVGGTGAVSDGVLSTVDAISADTYGNAVSVTPVRLWGEDRMATSTRVAEYVNEYVKTSTATVYPREIFVANGWAWADALSTSSYSYRFTMPLILTDSEGKLSADQVTYLKAALGNGSRVSVIGGPAKLAYDALADITNNQGRLQYIAGEDRYDTSKLVVREMRDLTGPYDTIAVATGKNFPDALVGGAFVGAQNGVLVLVGEQGESGANWNAAVKEAISSDAFRKQFTEGGVDNGPNKYILGGESAVSKQTAAVLESMI